MEKTVIEKLQQVPDYRVGNAIRHKLSEILMIGLLAMICNGNTYASMFIFGKKHEETLKTFLELPNGIPSQDTFEDVFAMLNPKTLKETFRGCIDDIRQAVQSIGGLTVSIDGKTVRGSKCSNKKATHIVTAFASDLRLVLGETAIDEKSNEITAIPKLLEMFCQKGMVVTIDAMGTQTAIVDSIIEKKADYVLSVKGNQPILHEDISLLIEHEVLETPKDELLENAQYACTIEKGHGRTETRECYICPEPQWLSTASVWKGLTGFGAIISKREETGKPVAFNTEYFIYSLKDTNADEILKMKRSHWTIENNLHWMLDVVFREDASRARLENAPENLNILRKEAMRLLKNFVDPITSSMTSKRYICSLDINYALNVVRSM